MSAPAVFLATLPLIHIFGLCLIPLFPLSRSFPGVGIRAQSVGDQLHFARGHTLDATHASTGQLFFAKYASATEVGGKIYRGGVVKFTGGGW